VIAGTLSSDDDMKYIALLYGEQDADPAPRTPEFRKMLGEFQSATQAMAEAGILVDSSPLQPLAGPVAVETAPMPLAARAAPTARAESRAVRAAVFAIPGRTVDESHMTEAPRRKSPG
jgi:hypothetical protein